MWLKRGVKAKGPAGARIHADNGSLADGKVYSKPVPFLHRESGKGMRGLSLEEANTIICGDLHHRQKAQMPADERNRARCRRPREGISEAGRRIDAAL